jgi:hypothetical protein
MSKKSSILAVLAVLSLALLVVVSTQAIPAMARRRPKPTPTAIAATPTPTRVGSAGGWVPAPGTTFQYQLQGTIDTSVNAAAFDIDGFDNSASVVTSLHAKGKRVICYMDAGTYEDWRSDASKFPASVQGSSNGWPGEKWLDIRQVSILQPIMVQRAKTCVDKGFDAIEWDNVDGYSNKTGFSLSANDQLTFNRMLATITHNAGLSVGLKNDNDQISSLVSNFDFAVNEQCNEYQECDTLLPFIRAGKAAFNVEYNLDTSQFCPSDKQNKISGIKKNLDLTAWIQSC